MFKTIRDTLRNARDKDYPERQFEVNLLSRVLDGTLYDHLQHDFHSEKTDGGEYIPLRDRRPSVRYGLCRVVVDDSISLLFSEGHFPAVECADEKTRDQLTALAKEVRLNEVMIDAATKGSVGSVAIFLRVLSNRVFLKVSDTQFLTPVWNPEMPDTLLRVEERYKIKGEVLKKQGYAIDDKDLQADFWFGRDWDNQAETWYMPWKVLEPTAAPTVDTAKTTRHGLGFVPVVWAKNLPGGDDIDGKCTFPSEVIDTSIEIDYQLSQAGRGLKYSSDPTLLIKEPAMDANGDLVKGGGNALMVSKEGDAKLLEINGSAAAAVIEYVRCLRELALETAHGNRANADKISAAQSGRAMELMNQALIWLADRLRISYGEGALLDLLRMVVQVSGKVKLKFKDGTEVGELAAKEPLSLRWPHWYAPTYEDKQAEAVTLTTLVEGGVMSKETAVNAIADGYDIEDPADELRRIQKDQADTAALQKPKMVKQTVFRDANQMVVGANEETS